MIKSVAGDLWIPSQCPIIIPRFINIGPNHKPNHDTAVDKPRELGKDCEEGGVVGKEDDCCEDTCH